MSTWNSPKDRTTSDVRIPDAFSVAQVTAILKLVNWLNSMGASFTSGHADLAGDVALFKFGLISKRRIRKANPKYSDEAALSAKRLLGNLRAHLEINPPSPYAQEEHDQMLNNIDQWMKRHG